MRTYLRGCGLGEELSQLGNSWMPDYDGNRENKQGKLIKRPKSNARSVAVSWSQSKPTLKLDWCSHEAAKYAVEHWHYSKRIAQKQVG